MEEQQSFADIKLSPTKRGVRESKLPRDIRTWALEVQKQHSNYGNCKNHQEVHDCCFKVIFDALETKLNYLVREAVADGRAIVNNDEFYEAVVWKETDK